MKKEKQITKMSQHCPFIMEKITFVNLKEKKYQERRSTFFADQFSGNLAIFAAAS
jgi:hypothetical protein